MKNANQVLALPDQRTYYNAVQLVMPIDVRIKLEKNDPLFSYLEAVEGVNFSKYVKSIRSNNTKSHDKGMMLKTLLFGYMENHRSLREIEHLCRTDLRYLYLSNEERPSFMAFQRLTEELTETIEEIFHDLSSQIAELTGCDTNVQYIDGTKIEANAQKNTFVYKKRVINAEDRLFSRITETIWQLNQEYGYSYRLKGQYDSMDMWYIAQYLMEVMVREKITPVYGKGHRKSRFQAYYDLFVRYAVKLEEYEYWLSVIGSRNSCSKTDHDATMMATKWDYYNQSGVTRPCYNCQIAVSDGVIINSAVYQTPADNVTWQEFLDQYNEYHGKYPEYPVADAGYGNYDNYMYNFQHGMNLVQKYTMYGKAEEPKFRRKIYHTWNWERTEEGFKVCPQGRVFDDWLFDKYQTSPRGNLTIKQVYGEKDHCEGCPVKMECNKGKEKHINRDIVQEQFYEEVDRQLSTEAGIRMKKQRCAQVEGAFGVIKQNMKFTRFTRRGMKNVKMEFLLVCLGYDLIKYHQSRLAVSHTDRLS